VVRPLGLGEERRRAHREQFGQARASGGKRRKGGGRKREKKKGKTMEKRKRKEGEGREKKESGRGGRIRAAIVAPVGHARRWSRARGQARHAGRGAQRDVTAGFRVKASSFGESGDRAGK